MLGLFDRDVFLKLGCCDLWEMTLEALRVTQPYRLASTTSERSNRRVISRMLPGFDCEQILGRIAAMVKTVAVLNDELLEDLEASDGFQRLGGIDDIDAGERILAAILIRDPTAKLLVSGDARFIAAMKGSAPAEWNLISEAVVSFQACLLAVERRFGFDIVRERAHPFRQCDGSLGHAFGHAAAHDAEEFRAALRSFDPCA